VADRRRNRQIKLRWSERETRVLKIAHHRGGSINATKALKNTVQAGLISRMAGVSPAQIAENCTDLDRTLLFLERFLDAEAAQAGRRGPLGSTCRLEKPPETSHYALENRPVFIVLAAHEALSAADLIEKKTE